MVIIDYGDGGKALVQPNTPLQALLLAEAHIRAQGCPHLSPLAVVKSAHEEKCAGEIIAAVFSGTTKLTLKELLPGLKLRAGASVIEIIRVRPTDREVSYKTQSGTTKMDSQRFLDLANQQGYRKIMDLKTFLVSLKDLLTPILAPVPLMWVLKLVTDAVRKKPLTLLGKQL